MCCTVFCCLPVMSYSVTFNLRWYWTKNDWLITKNVFRRNVWVLFMFCSWLFMVQFMHLKGHAESKHTFHSTDSTQLIPKWWIHFTMRNCGYYNWWFFSVLHHFGFTNLGRFHNIYIRLDVMWCDVMCVCILLWVNHAYELKIEPKLN